MTLTPAPLLYLTDGTTLPNGQLRRLNLIDPRAGYCLEAWRPAVAQYKEGGVWASSPLATGRRLVLRRFDNVIDVIEMRARAHSQDALIAYQNELLAWLEQAADYWTSRWPMRPVYLAARSAYEQNTRYAVVHAGSVTELSNPYDQPFLSRNNRAALMTLTLRLEHGLWQSHPPGEAACVAIGNRRLWTFTQWTTAPAPPTGNVLAMVEAQSGALLAGVSDTAKLYISSDGLTWSLLATLGSATSDALNALVKDNSGVLYAAVSGGSGVRGVWRSTDNGVNWTRVLDPTDLSGDAATTAGYYDVVFDAPRNRILACGGGFSAIEGYDAGIISESSDSGTNWRHWQKAPYNYFKSLALDHVGRIYVGWAADNGAVIRSTDTWFERRAPAVTWTPAQGYIGTHGQELPPTVWFRAEDITGVVDGGPVASWPAAPASTQSGVSAAQLVASQRPTYVANQLNGYPVVRFDGVDDWLNTSFVLGSSNWVAIALVKESDDLAESVTVFGEVGPASNTGKHYLEMRRAVSQVYLQTNNHRLNANVAPIWSADTWHIVSAQWSFFVPVRRVYFDGTLVGADEYTTPISNPPALRIGGRGDGTLPFDGDIVELIFFKHAITDDYRRQIEQYLNLKYNLGNIFYDYEIVSSSLQFKTYDLVRVDDAILHSAENTFGGGDGRIRRLSLPNFDVPATIATPAALLHTLYPDPQMNGRVWGGAANAVYKSENGGLTWTQVTSSAIGTVRAFLRSSSGALLAGGAGAVLLLEGGGAIETQSDETQVGAGATCAYPVYVANQNAQSNLTHVLVFDASAGTYTNYFAGDTYPHPLLPDAPAVGDIVYFGAQADLPDTQVGPFNSLIFNLVEAAQDITVIWEYWNGSGWSSLTAEDKTMALTATGVHSVVWRILSNWTTTQVNSISGWWVRARVTAVGGNPTPPRQGVQDVYSVRWGYVEVGEETVAGVLPALARIKYFCVGDKATGSPDMECDRLLVGLRSVARGETFHAYLNASDKQMPFGITVTASSPGSFQDSSFAPTGRRLTITSSATNTWQDVCSWQIATSIARDYYGSYRAFVRVHRTNGDADDVRLRLRLVFGSGGGATFSRDAFVLSMTDGELVELGRIDIPNTGVAGLTENLGDELRLVLQAYHTASSITTRVYDLILIPVDEWAVDATIPALNTTDASEVDGESYLDIDSVSSPKEPLVAYNRTLAGLIKVRYQAIAGGPAMLQAGARQRLWFLAALYNGQWASYPEMVGAVQIEAVQRYLGLRGDQ
ncbi:MAG TPA: hypothetical protein VNK95_11865 [Caldilineaceae bacterium]|nr:hypothetical protein [Caldilineaceae bacterium]